MVKSVTIGSLYLDEQPAVLGSEYEPGQSIRIGSSVEQNKIHWMIINGLFVPSKCLLRNVSWDDLNKQGLVFGQRVIIDRLAFQCRLLKVGSRKDEKNEWDEVKNIIGDIDLRSNPGELLFWGQESLINQEQYRVVRGCKTRYWGYNASCKRFRNVGYLPALEPVTVEVNESLTGEDLMIWTKDGDSVIGRLVEYSDYDLLLADGACITGISSAVRNQSGVTAVERTEIQFVQTFEK